MSVELSIAWKDQLVMLWLPTCRVMVYPVLVTESHSPLLCFSSPITLMMPFGSCIHLFVLALAYHAGLNNKLRSSVLDDWISSKIQVVVATVAFGYDFR